MSYGLKRGIKAPGEFGIGDMFGLGLASAAGIVAALVTDYNQKGAASAIYTLNEWAVSFGSMMGYPNVPLWSVVAGLMAIGAGSVLYFQPITRQGAFAQGFGLLAVMMTAIPADIARSLETVFMEELHPLHDETDVAAGGHIVTAAYMPGAAGQVSGSAASGEARVYLAQDSRAARYDVRLTINFPNGAPNLGDRTVRARLHNEDMRQTYDLFRGTVESRDRNTLVVNAVVPARAAQGRLWVLIEAPGYAIEEQSANARVGEPLEWRIDMKPSTTPLFLQRLGKTYRF